MAFALSHVIGLPTSTARFGVRSRNVTLSLPNGQRPSQSQSVSRRALLQSLAFTSASAWVLPSMGMEENSNGKRPFQMWPTSGMKSAFADGMATGMQDYELAIRDRKKALFEQLDSNDIKRVLDIGIGTGPNLAYLVRTSRFTTVAEQKSSYRCLTLPLLS